MSASKTITDFKRESLKEQIRMNESSLELYRSLLASSKRNFIYIFSFFLCLLVFGIAMAILGEPISLVYSFPPAIASRFYYRDIKNYKYSVSLYERANETFLAKSCSAFEAARYRKYGVDGI